MTNLAIIDQSSLLKTAEIISKSDIIPKAYQGKPGNIYLILELAKRLNMDSLTMLNNVYIIYNQPCLKSSFLIALANSSGILKERITFIWEGEGLNETQNCRRCTAHAVLNNNAIIEFTFAASTAIKEGWATKPGNKYLSMLDLMLSYKAAAFLTRLYIPDVTAGLYTQEEIEDIEANKEKNTKNNFTTSSNNIIDIESIENHNYSKIQQEKSFQAKKEFNAINSFNEKKDDFLSELDSLYEKYVGEYDIDIELQGSLKNEFLQYFKNEFIRNNGNVKIDNLFFIKLTAKRLTILADRNNLIRDEKLNDIELKNLKKVVYEEYMKDPSVSLLDLFSDFAEKFIPF